MKLKDYLERAGAVEVASFEDFSDLNSQLLLSTVSSEAFDLLAEKIDQHLRFTQSLEAYGKSYGNLEQLDQVGLEHYEVGLRAMFMAQGLNYPVKHLIPSLEDGALAIGHDGPGVGERAKELAQKAVEYVRQLVADAVAKLKDMMGREKALSESMNKKAHQAVALLRNVKEPQLLALGQDKTYSLPQLLIDGDSADTGKVVQRLNGYFAAPSPFGTAPAFTALSGVSDPAQYRDKVQDVLDDLTKAYQAFEQKVPELSTDEKAMGQVKELKLQELVALANGIEKVSQARTNYMHKVLDAHSRQIVEDTRRYEQIDQNAEDSDIKVTDALKVSTNRFAIESVYQKLSTRLNNELAVLLKALQPYCNLGASQA